MFILYFLSFYYSPINLLKFAQLMHGQVVRFEFGYFTFFTALLNHMVFTYSGPHETLKRSKRSNLFSYPLATTRVKKILE